ncbi:MAG: T9SS type A sorting domain-containing protein [Flavobacteriales bacterium]
MRSTTTLLLGLCASTLTHAQLINGSFEQDGQFTDTGWTGTCAQPGAGEDGAPGAGMWHATVMPGNFQGCYPAYLYQPIPGAMDGQLYLLGGWIRCSTEEPCLGGYLGIGRWDGSAVEVDDLSGGQGTDWTYVEIVDTAEVDAGEQAVVVLTAGSIGGPISPTPTHFDGIQLDLAMAVNAAEEDRIRHYLDPTTGVLYLHAGAGSIIDVGVFDLTGRRVPVQQRYGPRTTQVDVNGLRTGAYLAQVRTTAGDRTIRFTTW